MQPWPLPTSTSTSSLGGQDLGFFCEDVRGKRRNSGVGTAAEVRGGTAVVQVRGWTREDIRVTSFGG